MNNENWDDADLQMQMQVNFMLTMKNENLEEADLQMQIQVNCMLTMNNGYWDEATCVDFMLTMNNGYWDQADLQMQNLQCRIYIVDASKFYANNE